MFTHPSPNIPIKKSLAQIALYKEAGPKFGNILWEIKTKLSNGWYKNGKELQDDFVSKSKNVFGKDVIFPFARQENNLGENFYNKICISVDDCVAHGSHKGNFIEGDLISVDFGLGLSLPSQLTKPGSFMSFPTLNFDAAFTTTYAAKDDAWVQGPLDALKRVKQPLKDTSQISAIIEQEAIYYGTDIVVALTGHGIGTSLHEAPLIYNKTGDVSTSPLFEGLVICIEPIFTKTDISYTEKKDNSSFYAPKISKIYMGEDNWSIYSVNEQPGTHFESMFLYEDGKLIDLLGMTNW